MDNTTEAKNAIQTFLCEAKGDPFSLAHVLYAQIIAAETDDQPILLQYACELFLTCESKESYIVTDSEYLPEKEKLKELYEDITDSILLSYLKRGHQELEFYTQLWKAITSNSVFPDEKSKVFSLYEILIDARIPYFHIDAEVLYSMSNERFKELRKENRSMTQKIRFILLMKFEQKTEKASALLNELGIPKPSNQKATREEIAAYERKLIILVEIIQQLETRQADITREIHERLSLLG